MDSNGFPSCFNYDAQRTKRVFDTPRWWCHPQNHPNVHMGVWMKLRDACGVIYILTYVQRNVNETTTVGSSGNAFQLQQAFWRQLFWSDEKRVFIVDFLVTKWPAHFSCVPFAFGFITSAKPELRICQKVNFPFRIELAKSGPAPFVKALGSDGFSHWQIDQCPADTNFNTKSHDESVNLTAEDHGLGVECQDWW